MSSPQERNTRNGKFKELMTDPPGNWRDQSIRRFAQNMSVSVHSKLDLWSLMHTSGLHAFSQLPH
jgi:hypothetical protein